MRVTLCCWRLCVEDSDQYYNYQIDPAIDRRTVSYRPTLSLMQNNSYQADIEAVVGTHTNVLIPTASRVAAKNNAALINDAQHLLVLTDVAIGAKWPKEGVSSAWKAVEGADSSLARLKEGHGTDASETVVPGIGGSKKKRVRSKRFECADCSKAFATKYECTRHERVHTGERPFRCSKCVRAFADKGNLKKHQLVHTRHRPHICACCHKSFSRRTHLRMHALRVHSQLLAVVDDGNGSVSGSDDGRSGNESDRDTNS